MRRRLIYFAADVNRYCPLATVSLATLVCVPSLAAFVEGRLVALAMLERYAISLVVATIAVRVVSRLIVTYAARNVIAGEQASAETDLDVPAPGRSAGQSSPPSRR